MAVIKVQDMKYAEALFGGWDETIILSCLQKIMGEVFTCDTKNTFASAMAILGDFCFFAGEPEAELVMYKPESCGQDFIIMIPRNEYWAKLIEDCYKEKAKKVTRYAIKKEPGIFNEEMLAQAAASLPAGYSMKMIDEDIYNQCRQTGWCGDLVSQYKDYEMYEKLGIGVAILKDEEIAAGASAYSRYRDGIEIEIDTKENYRRQGLAYISGAKLILECLKRNLYPSWDAQNKGSVALAEKLGYHYANEYTAYEIWGY